MNTNLKSGKCPICNSNEIYSDNGLFKTRRLLVVSNSKKFFLVSYICLDCGHFEEHINDAELNDSMKEEIRSSWQKIG